MILCIDIGNTHTHYGVVNETGALFQRHVQTRLIDDPEEGLPAVLTSLTSGASEVSGIAFCSVVPTATTKLLDLFRQQPPSVPVLHLNYLSKLGVALHYPRPSEIGPDRLANAAGARALFSGPVIVIDMGTAVTFDIISQEHGYEGGIIAPGVEVMRRYLHEQTALLPLLDDALDVPRAIGQSTTEAMRIGTVIGFGGMIQALLDAVINELHARREDNPVILATGGSAELLRKTLRTPFQTMPDLTLRGLAAAWALNHPAP